MKDRTGKKAIYGYVYSKSYLEVKKKLILKRAEYSEKENKPSNSEMKDALFSEIAELWLRSIQSSVKESTWIKYRNMIEGSILPFLGSEKLSQINYPSVYNFCTTLLESGGKNQNGLSTKTVSDTLSLTKSIMKYASRMNYITDRTALDVSIKVKNPSLRVLSIHEEQILIQSLSKNITFTELGILICLFTGIRIGELCALTWEDISLENNVIHIHRTMQRIQKTDGVKKTAILITEPKSQCSIRNIPIASYGFIL